MRPIPPLALLACAIAACHGGNATTPPVVVQPTELRCVGTRTAGGDAVAAAFLAATSGPVAHDARAPYVPADPALEQRLRFHALAHLEASGLASGSGLRLEGSARIRRLALDPGAPPDGNSSGTNLDETAQLELEQLAALAGSIWPAGTFPLLFPWPEASAEFASAGDPRRGAYAAQRAPALDRTAVAMEQVGFALYARALAASALLREGRGSRPGADPESGRLGLALLQQAIAIEETLFDGLFVRADPAASRSVGRLTEPVDYDPAFVRRWLPARFQVSEDPALPGAPASYAPYDQASSLAALAQVLRGAAEIGFLGSDANPMPALRDVLNGHPFGFEPRARRRTPGLGFPTGDPVGVITYEEHVKPIFDSRCVTCHRGSSATGGFDISTIEGILRGGNHRATNPTIRFVDGRPVAAQSLLWQILRPNPPILIRMPENGPYLSDGNIEIIGQWIDGGLQRSPPKPPVPGIDLVNVSVKNLVAMHLDPSGALHDRHEGDAGSGFASAEATGQALIALAAAARVAPLGGARATLDLAARFAREQLTDAAGASFLGVTIAAPQPGARAELAGHAALTAGLFAAGRVLGRAADTERARALATVLVREFFDPQTDLCTSTLGQRERQYRAPTIALVLEALREAAFAGVADAGAAHDRFVRRLLPALVFAEWDGLGELLQDGQDDTDHNGIPEPRVRAPVFAGELREGPDRLASDASVSWSRHIQPLFRSACQECHLDGALRGNYAVDTPALARTHGDSGGAFPLVVPGAPEQSLLWQKLAHRRPPIGDQMPLQRPPLDAHGLELVRRWILEGASSR